MKRIITSLFTTLLLALISSCDDKPVDIKDEAVNEEQDSILTYNEQKRQEALQIEQWLADKHIDVISLDDFLNDTITDNPDVGPDNTRNEYVLLGDSVFMQIVRRGDGSILGPGEVKNYNARYTEINVGTGDTLTMNLYQQELDAFSVSRTGDNYTAAFHSGVMKTTYGASVPAAWTMALPYIKPGSGGASSVAKVRLIVPHTKGTIKAAADVYPAFYEIIISTQRW